MRANPRDVGGNPVRHSAGQRLVNHMEAVGKVMSTVHGIYSAGKAIMPYVRPAMTALAAVL